MAVQWEGWASMLHSDLRQQGKPSLWLLATSSPDSSPATSVHSKSSISWGDIPPQASEERERHLLLFDGRPSSVPSPTKLILKWFYATYGQSLSFTISICFTLSSVNVRFFSQSRLASIEDRIWRFGIMGWNTVHWPTFLFQSLPIHLPLLAAITGVCRIEL